MRLAPWCLPPRSLHCLAAVGGGPRTPFLWGFLQCVLHGPGVRDARRCCSRPASGQDGASRGGIRSRGERRGARPDSCRPRPAKDSQGIGRQGFVALGGLRLAFGAARRGNPANRSRSRARGRRAPDSGGLGAPQAGPSGERVGAPTKHRVAWSRIVRRRRSTYLRDSRSQRPEHKEIGDPK